MSVHLVTFSDSQMTCARDLCEQSALRNGVNSVHVWADHHVWANWEYFTIERRQQRGCGFWVWKPWIIRETLEYAQFGDCVVYSDAGIEFIAPVRPIVDRTDQDIFLFGNNWEHAHWCKRDVVEKVWPTFANAPMDRLWNAVADSATWTRFGKQAQASVIFLRVTDYTRAFVKEWLDWCLFEDGRLIDDSPSRLPNHPEFREHRHDQAILTTMAYREGIKLHYWPAVYNKGGSPEFVYEKLPEYADDDYPVLFSHHRRRDHEWQ